MLSNSYKYYYYRGGGGAVGTMTEADYVANGSTGCPFSLTLRWTATQDVVNNQSTINYAIDAEAFAVEGTQYVKLGSASTFTLSCYQDNQSYSSTVDYVDTNGIQKVYVGTPVTLATGNFVIDHKTNGDKTIKLRIAEFPIYNAFKLVDGVETTTVSWGTGAGSSATCSIEGTNDILDTISRHALIYSAHDFSDEDTVAIEYAVPSGITGYIYLSLDSVDTTETTELKAVTGAGTYNYSFSANDQKKLWTIQDQGLVTKRVRFFIKSVSNIDGLTYREPSDYVNLNIINYMPTLDTEIYDTNQECIDYLTGNKYTLVRHVSDAYFSTGGQAHKGATINSQSIKNSGVTLYGASGTFEKVQGTDTGTNFDFTIIDSYGRTHQETMQFDTASGRFVPYVKLTCSSEVTPMTADGDVAVTLTGKYYQGSFGLKTNKMRMHYEIAKNNGEPTMVDMGYIYPTITGSDYTYTFTISGLEYLSVYDLIVRVSDEVSVEPAESHTVLAAVPIFDWSRTDFNFNVPVNIEGDLTVTGNITAGGNTVPTIVAQGKSGIWTYRTWSDGTAECWGKKDVSVTFPTSANWGGLFTTSAISASNVNFPFGLFAETPVVNASLLIRSAGGILMAPGGAGSNIANMDQTGVYEIARGSYVSGSQAYTINYDVKGRWK